MSTFDALAWASAQAKANASHAAYNAGSRILVGPFAHPLYRRFWMAGLLSFTAFWVQLITRSWLIQEMTGSPLMVTLIPVAMLLPMLFLSIPAGVLADRFDRRRIIIAMEAAAFIGYLALTIIAISGATQVWHVLALSALTGSLMALASPSRMSLVPNLVPAGDVRRAIGLSAVVFNLAQIAGPAVGGILIGRMGTDVALAASLFFSIPALLLYMSVRVERKVPRPATRTDPLAAVKQGFSYAFRDPVLRNLLLSGLVVVATIGTWAALMPTFASDVLNQGAEALGALTLAMGVGALAGSLVVIGFGGRISHEKIEVLAVLGLALSVIGFALSPWLSLSLLFAMLAGLSQTSFMVTNMTVVQMAASEEYRGRVLGIRFLIIGTQPIGTIALGLAAEALGPQAAVVIVAVIGAVVYGAVQLATRPHREAAASTVSPASEESLRLPAPAGERASTGESR